MESMELVTVIIPVYKTREYLEACVESVRSQTYTILEIILVDDGSPDDCGEICDRLAALDNRIKVIHQENQGLSAARNAALDIMAGDMVMFVDSDDTIDKDMIKNLLDDMSKYNADIAQCQFYEVFSGETRVPNHIRETLVCDTEKALLIDLSAKGGTVAACGKLYKRKIFETHRFDVGKLGEDTFAIIGSLRQAKWVVIDHRPMYYYYHRNNSITTNKFSKRTLDAIKGARRNMDIVSKEFPGALPGAMFRLDWSYLWVLDRILLEDNWKHNKYIAGILRHIRKHLFRVIKSPYFTKSRKMGALISSVSPGVYRYLVLQIWNKRWN